MPQNNSFATNTPTAYHNKAQGRGAHPGYGIMKHAYPNGVSQWAMGYCGTPFAYKLSTKLTQRALCDAGLCCRTALRYSHASIIV